MKIHPSKLLLCAGALAFGGALPAPALRADDVPASSPAPALKDAGSSNAASPSSGDAAAKKKKRRKRKKKTQEQDGSGPAAPAEGGPPTGSGS